MKNKKSKKKKSNMGEMLVGATLLGGVSGIGSVGATAGVSKGIITHPMLNFKVGLIQ